MIGMQVGHVSGIWRFPVKSMGGERLDRSEVGPQGLAGDRGWAVRDAKTGGILTAKRYPILLQCAASCRLVYTQGAGAQKFRVVTWAPGEKRAALVATVSGSEQAADVAAAYTPKGRLWVAWWRSAGDRFEAARGDGAGRGGTVRVVGRPGAKGTAGVAAAVSSGESLVLVANWVPLGSGKDAARYVSVVAG